MKNAEKMIKDMKAQLKEKKEEKIEAQEVVDQVVATAQHEIPSKEGKEEELSTETNSEVEDEQLEFEETEELEAEIPDQAEEIAEEKDTKKLRKRIEKNYRQKLKEKDEEIKKLEDAIRSAQLTMAEQKGFQEALKKPETPEVIDNEPDPTLDPEEHHAWKFRQLEKENEELKKAQSEHSSFIQEQRDRESIRSLESDFKSRNPDVNYDGAKQFLKDRESTLIKLQYPNATDAQINDYFAKYEMDLFKNLASQGKNGTDVLVEMAKEHGYEEKSRSKAPAKRPNFQKLKANQEKNTSLIGGSDSVKEHEIKPEAVLNMSMEQLLQGGKDLFKKAYSSIR